MARIFRLFSRHLREPNDEEVRRHLMAALQENLVETLETSEHDRWISLLKDICMTEISRQLHSININSRHALKKVAGDLLEDPSFLRVLARGRPRSTFENDLSQLLHFSSSAANSLGVATDTNELNKLLGDKQKPPIAIAFPPILLGVAAIFFYLKVKKGYHLDLKYNFPHATDMAARLTSRDISVQACVLGDAPSIKIINKTKSPLYHASMFLPRSEQRIVTPQLSWFRRQRTPITSGVFSFVSEDITTAMFQFEYLKRAGKIDPSKVSLDPKEPHESVKLLNTEDEDRRVILWTPHWQIYSRLDMGYVVPTSCIEAYWFDAILFLQHSFRERRKRTARALIMAIQDAWLSLLEDTALREEVIDIMLADLDFSRFIKRFSGIGDAVC